jgi:hypothetical protein
MTVETHSGRVRLPPRQTDALPVFLARHPLVLDVERRGSDDTVEVLEIISHRLHPFLTRQCIGEADERGPHSPHHLNRIRAEVPDLIEREAEIVLPRGRREDQSQSAVRIDGVAGVQFRRAETAQEVLELVDRLNPVVGSLIAGDNALMAMSTRSRIGYFGSCSKVRSRLKWTARLRASSGSGVPES